MMKRNVLILIIGLALALALAACGQSNGQNAAGAQSSGGEASGNNAVTGNGAGDREITTIVTQIGDNFDGALSTTGQLALGTLRLEDGELAVSEEQAAELLPLWQALQSLSNSETTAEVELNAMVKQIEGTMTADQVSAIAGMQLTEDSLTEMMESGELGLRGFGGRNATVESEDGAALPPGGFGGGPGGGFGSPGGGPGGGLGGGFGAGGELSEDEIATRRAEFARGAVGDMGEQFLIGTVVRLMQTRTGTAPEGLGSRFDTVFNVVAEETGLTVEEIQAAMAGGQSLTEIIESNGGDVEAVRAAMIEAFKALPNAEGFDAAEQADQWLNQQAGQE